MKVYEQSNHLQGFAWQFRYSRKFTKYKGLRSQEQNWSEGVKISVVGTLDGTNMGHSWGLFTARWALNAWLETEQGMITMPGFEQGSMAVTLMEYLGSR
jgi:hypothetical protein